MSLIAIQEVDYFNFCFPGEDSFKLRDCLPFGEVNICLNSGTDPIWAYELSLFIWLVRGCLCILGGRYLILGLSGSLILWSWFKSTWGSIQVQGILSKSNYVSWTLESSAIELMGRGTVGVSILRGSDYNWCLTLSMYFHPFS